MHRWSQFPGTAYRWQKKIELLYKETAQCSINDKIVDWKGMLWSIQAEQLYLTAEGGGNLATSRISHSFT
jgi:hypothetical protein